MSAIPAIRLATVEDAAAIAALSRDLIEAGLPWRWTRDRVRNAVLSDDTNVAVVGPAGWPIAFGIMEYQEEDAHLLLFAVEPKHQRQGLGSALLAWLEDSARAAGVRRIEVEARRQNVAARSFYNEHGYHEWAIEKQMYSGLADGVRLEKWLRRASSGAARGAA
jgi:[ribosomal protein S18]-alanine N-acetyltransferase